MHHHQRDDGESALILWQNHHGIQIQLGESYL
jgi:hypothetical protein